MAVRATRRARARVAADPRILGTGDFVTALLRETPTAPGGSRPLVPLATLMHRLAARLGLSPAALTGPTRSPAAVTARQLLAYLWVEYLGQRASELARALGQTRGNVSTAAQRGAAHAPRWRAEIPRWCRR